jgi:hypothetical protein
MALVRGFPSGISCTSGITIHFSFNGTVPSVNAESSLVKGSFVVTAAEFLLVGVEMRTPEKSLDQSDEGQVISAKASN